MLLAHAVSGGHYPA